MTSHEPAVCQSLIGLSKDAGSGETEALASTSTIGPVCHFPRIIDERAKAMQATLMAKYMTQTDILFPRNNQTPASIQQLARDNRASPVLPGCAPMSRQPFVVEKPLTNVSDCQLLPS